MSRRDEERERYALLSLTFAVVAIGGHMALTRTPVQDYWWPVVLVPVVLPVAAIAAAPTRLGRWVAGAAALLETPFALLFFAYGGVLVIPSVAMLWVAACT